MSPHLPLTPDEIARDAIAAAKAGKAVGEESKVAIQLDPSISASDGSKPSPNGIGGWLVLVALGQVFGLIRTVITLVEYYSSPQTHTAFAKIPLAAGGELGINAAYLALLILSTYAFFNKKGYFPSLFVTEVLASPLVFCLDAAWISATTNASFSGAIDTDGLARSVGACIPGAIWIAYLFISKRVKNTFIK